MGRRAQLTPSGRDAKLCLHFLPPGGPGRSRQHLPEARGQRPEALVSPIFPGSIPQRSWCLRKLCSAVMQEMRVLAVLKGPAMSR